MGIRSRMQHWCSRCRANVASLHKSPKDETAVCSACLQMEWEELNQANKPVTLDAARDRWKRS